MSLKKSGMVKKEILKKQVKNLKKSKQAKNLKKKHQKRLNLLNNFFFYFFQ